MVAQAFTVLTEFKFDVGHAITDSEAVAGAVGKISEAASQAQFAMARLSMSFAGSLFGGGGFLGAMLQASKVADDFANAQISLANTLVMTGMAFEERMDGAAQLMRELNTLAVDNSLSFKEMLNITKLLTPMMLNEGTAGPGLRNVTDISRTFLKSAPTLGIDPTLAQGELLRTMGGQASMGDTLFRRLTAETNAMKKFMGDTKAWNLLPAKQRVEILSKALQQFANDADAVHARVMTLSGQLAQLKNNVSNLILPIGQALNTFLSTALQRINNGEVMGRAKVVFDNLARIMKNFLTTPEAMYADFVQMSALSGDVKAAGKIVSVIAILEGAVFVMGMLGIQIPIVTAALTGLLSVVHFFTTAAMGSGALALTGGIMGVLEAITGFVSGVLAPLLLLVGVFQLFSRALAYAKLYALENIALHMPRISTAMAQFAGILGVLRDGFDLLARGLGWLLDPSKFLGFINLVSIFTSVLETLSGWLGRAMMGFQGVALWLMEFVNQVGSLLTGGGFDPHKMDDAANFGMEEMYKRIFGPIEEGKGGIVNQTVHMDVKMQNHFKEMMEPDRVAFTIKDQLLKASRNKTQAAGRGFEAAGAQAGR